jgi:small subunit ribosomal protein S9
MAEDVPTPDDATPEEEAPVEPQPAAEQTQEAAAEQPAPAEEPAEETAAEEPVAESPADEPAAEGAGDESEPEQPRVKPSIPGADLEVDLVLDGEASPRDEYGYGDEDGDQTATEDTEEDFSDQPVAATIDLAADARYRATGKRKTAVARVILRPGAGAYIINGKPLEDFFPRATLQRQIRQPLEAVGYEERMDVVARMHGGGVSSQAGALRHGISKALLDADPNLRGELKRRGFLTRDSRVKERKKAGLKKARKRPQFSKR